jgi:hypothetical protein
VPFPTATLLVEGGIADEFAIHEGEQREVAVEVDVLAPVANDLRVLHSMFDKHALGLGDGGKEFVKSFFVVFAKRAELGFGAVLQFYFFGVLREFEFE